MSIHTKTEYGHKPDWAKESLGTASQCSSSGKMPRNEARSDAWRPAGRRALRTTFFRTLMPTNRSMLLPQSTEQLMNTILPLFQPELRLVGLSVFRKKQKQPISADRGVFHVRDKSAGCFYWGMRIAHVQDPFIPGLGYQENHLPMKQYELGHDVYIVTSHSVPIKSDNDEGQQTFDIGKYTYQNVPTFRLRSLHHHSIENSYLIGLSNKLDEVSPDIIHLHGLFDYKTLQVIWYVKDSDVPLVVDVHFDNDNFHLDSIFKKIVFSIFKMLFLPIITKEIDLYMPVNTIAKRFLQEDLNISEDKMKLLPLGIDDTFKPDRSAGLRIRNELNIPEEAIVIADSGKFNPTKDTDVLLSAFINLCDEHSNTHLLLIGDGPKVYVEQLLQKASQAGISDKVTLTGWINYKDLSDYYNAADVGVMPGKLASIKDALGVGLPLIVPDNDATRYFVSNDNGETFERGNIADLKSTMGQYINNDRKRKIDGQHSRELVDEKLSWETIADTSIEIYNEYV